MKTLKYFFERFISDTPTALKSLQKILLAISGAAATTLTVLLQYELQGQFFYEALKYVIATCTFATAMLQFATADPKLREQNKK